MEKRRPSTKERATVATDMDRPRHDHRTREVSALVATKEGDKSVLHHVCECKPYEEIAPLFSHALSDSSDAILDLRSWQEQYGMSGSLTSTQVAAAFRQIADFVHHSPLPDVLPFWKWPSTAAISVVMLLDFLAPDVARTVVDRTLDCLETTLQRLRDRNSTSVIRLLKRDHQFATLWFMCANLTDDHRLPDLLKRQQFSFRQIHKLCPIVSLDACANSTASRVRNEAVREQTRRHDAKTAMTKTEKRQLRRLRTFPSLEFLR